MMSAQVDVKVWEAFDRVAASNNESKRTHLERALLLYIDPSFFDSDNDYDRLIEKYGIGK